MNAPFQQSPATNDESLSPDAIRPPLLVLIAAPRGFCAGVDRAIEIVERALTRYGAPVYVRHEIVHNRYVVDGLKAKGAVFVEELDEVPADTPVVFSAHGVPKAVPAEAERRGLTYVDATCPLVSKVHRQAERQIEAGRHIVFIGHKGHPEVIGTFGQVPEGQMTLVETEADVATLDFPADMPLSFLTQTTLSVEDTARVIEALTVRFPHIVAPKAEDICYATSNRQAAVKELAPASDLVLVIGAPNSSNSLRLVEVAERCGTSARLIQRASEIDPAWLEGVGTLGLTAGASAPETLVREVIDALGQWRTVEERPVKTAEEHMVFKLPRQLTE
ncbi:MAG: 4-hydroxy-3-methylbut-2-enyl diphosphate reductase [Pseudomonadota bacterium]|jgi:4-hydroxy-3-methylbut-2-enyl diphosphate reductase